MLNIIDKNNHIDQITESLLNFVGTKKNWTHKGEKCVY